MKKTYIIAEAGVNHNGDLSLAKTMILEAKKAGADAVKFQTFVSEKLVSRFAPKAEYQKKTTGNDDSQLKMLQKLELSFQDFLILKKYAQEVGIDFVSTPFDMESIEFLITLDMPFWKIPSGEITNKSYLQRIEQTKRPIIMSTGMCTMEEIEEALNIFKSYSQSDITLLHCNTEYPTPYEDVNLYAMETIRRKFNVRTGYSDHTQGIEVAIAAAALGAEVIEKHFTLDRTMPGPDHKASLEPSELEEMIRAIRHIDLALGDGIKKPTISEVKNKNIARKSIVAGRDIQAGETLTTENITVKRPGDGISPMRWNEILGLKANRSYQKDEKLDTTL
jgi:N,N'-diacetyllegionaminate synthase